MTEFRSTVFVNNPRTGKPWKSEDLDNMSEIPELSDIEVAPEFMGTAQEIDVSDNVEFGAPRARYKWHTPDGDALVAHMARVSNTKANLGDPGEKLIGYLIRNHHWSPFEMVNLCVEIHTERDISAQILRHSKEFRFQEFSTRYAEVEDLRWSVECRFQDAKNRQNSLTPEQVACNEQELEATLSWWDAVVNETRVRSLEGYRYALERGIAKECARRILPFGMCPTVMYINSNIRGWIHYLAERTKPGVQKEHREIALAVEPIFAENFPEIWQAVLDYRAAEELKNWKIDQFDKMHELIAIRCGEAGLVGVEGIPPVDWLASLLSTIESGEKYSRNDK